ncbi:hypothetical protein IT407_01055 [Candidatus Uhrbacteria bacterium]|nr:hypothetical protein [Candidatus Uhrbacteria bacterium]
MRNALRNTAQRENPPAGVPVDGWPHTGRHAYVPPQSPIGERFEHSAGSKEASIENTPDRLSGVFKGVEPELVQLSAGVSLGAGSFGTGMSRSYSGGGGFSELRTTWA